jgi:hypothetical protein
MHGPEAVSDKHEKKYRMTEYKRETRKEFAVGWKSAENNASNLPPGERPTNAPNPIIADQRSSKNHSEPGFRQKYALGHKRTSEDVRSMSALPPKADIG